MIAMDAVGNRSFLSGSSAEGQTYARHMANQNIQDIDILIHCGIIKLEKNLIRTNVPGFVRIKFDDDIEATGSIVFIAQDDANGVRCLNGFRLKEIHCTKETNIGAPLSYVHRSGQTSSDASSAAATQTLSYESIDISRNFHNALLEVEQQRNQLNFDTIRTNYVLFSKGVTQSIAQYAMPLYQTPSNTMMFEEQHINEQTFRDLFTLVGPVYDHSLPQVTLVRIKALLNFYDKYAYIGNPKNIKDMADYFQSCAPTDVDLVPSLQLKFWPTDIQPFLERIKNNRPLLYHLILDKASMHVIPKWSTKTPRCDRELEFRYSFSAIELILAQQRSNQERVLNGIARSIYYKFLKDQKVSTQNVIPSYFIKTTVLWMCETMDLTIDNEETLTKRWLQYAIDLLNKRYCPHYIIPDLNILEPYSIESLQKAVEILSQVDINETHKIQMFSASGQEFYRNKYKTNLNYFLSRMRVIDIINALNDYRQFKKNWISLDTQLIIDDDEIDMNETLTILNTLRGLDGDYENWKKFRQIFLNCQPPLQPIWGETVNVDSAVDFAEGLFSIGIILTFMNKYVSSNSLLPLQGAECNMQDFQNYQNVIHQYLDPQILSSSLQSTYAYWYNKSVAAFERRRLIDYHPYGPEIQSTEVKQEENRSKSLIELCRNAPDQNMILRDLFLQALLNTMTEDELIALSIQRSIEDQGI
ncbi:unnamed protein product [Rotaria sordida]|uniref:Mab-21-like HhH/H2TH-like domain-containing protein n=1 Tax=Rotaria sordida TaxID=392033 RepID=A0A814RB52_9BILA|nr:unnamed protein product [Rotaria sordida]